MRHSGGSGSLRARAASLAKKSTAGTMSRLTVVIHVGVGRCALLAGHNACTQLEALALSLSLTQRSSASAGSVDLSRHTPGAPTVAVGKEEELGFPYSSPSALDPPSLAPRPPGLVTTESCVPAD